MLIIDEKTVMLLEGITVLDLTRVIAGPSCTRTLADLGAEVIKIEPPDGDMLRRGVPKVNGVGVGFAQLNAGKKLLSIDLSQQAGLEIVLKLVQTADVIVENYRPGVAARLGIGYGDVKEINPGVIYCSISGYGQDGPAANRRAYAPVIHAELGLVALNARERGTDPLPEAVAHADFAVGAQATTAILAAVIHKLRTGEGQSIDVSMAESMLAMNEWTAVEVNGGSEGLISPFRPGKAAMLRFHDDTWVQVPGNPTTWVFGVARALDKTDELHERGWFEPTDTQGCEEEIKEIVQRWARAYETLEAFEQALDSARLPLGRVQTLAETPGLDWALARNAFVDIDVNGEKVKVPRSPFRFSVGAVGPKSGSYPQGEDNRTLLKLKLGIGDEVLDRLESEGVLVGNYLKKT
jgi:CoA:oxalate CoA-transferase